MATVHIGAARGPVGFTRVVAIKELHPHLAEDSRIRSMFVDEAYIVSRIRHVNVVQLHDVTADHGALTLVMDYVKGVSLHDLACMAEAAGERMPQPIAFGIACDLLAGLHAAHEARGENGELLGIVHRDVSPHNVMVGADGVARLLDFGIAWAKRRSVAQTEDGKLKGKLAYMAPEQFEERGVDRRADIYSAAIVLWEMLSGKRLFEPHDLPALVIKKLDASVDRPSERRRSIADSVDAVIMRALMRDPGIRYQTARDMLLTLERNAHRATPAEVAEWVGRIAHARLAELDAAADQLCEQVEASDAGGGQELRRSVRPPPAPSTVSLPHVAIPPNPPPRCRASAGNRAVTQREILVPPIPEGNVPAALRLSQSRSREMYRAGSRKRAVLSIAFGFVLGGFAAFVFGAIWDREASAEPSRERRLRVDKNVVDGETRPTTRVARERLHVISK